LTVPSSQVLPPVITEVVSQKAARVDTQTAALTVELTMYIRQPYLLGAAALAMDAAKMKNMNPSFLGAEDFSFQCAQEVPVLQVRGPTSNASLCPSANSGVKGALAALVQLTQAEPPAGSACCAGAGAKLCVRGV
jgi:hypothetical protein